MTGLSQICVVGGGIAGLAVACLLAQRGADVVVLEQAEALREVGAGLQISPNGLAVLRAMGLEPQLAACSSAGRAVSLRRFDTDAQVARLDLTRLPEGQAYHFVHRADLIDLLAGAARAAGVQVRLLQKVRAITPGTPARVQLETGAELRADLVIDAGGLHSKLRGVLNGQGAPFFTGQVAWRALVPNTQERKGEVQVHMAPGRHIVSYPLRGGALINLVAVQERALWAEEGWAHEDDPRNLRAAFADAGAAVQELLGAVDQLHLWGLFRHRVAQRWTAEGCALLGDAAHPTLPFLAQGANMALEDAWALAHFALKPGDLAAQLRSYQALRRPRALRVIETANKNAWRYHLPAGPLRFAAHTGLSLVSRFAPAVLTKGFDWLYGYDITAELPDARAVF